MLRTFAFNKMTGMTCGVYRTAAATLSPLGPRRPQQARRQHTAAAAAKDAVPSFPFSRPSDYQPPKEYAELRASKCPFGKGKLWDGSNIWLITRLKDVNAVLSDDRFSKVRTHPNFPEMNPGGKEAAKTQTATFVDMDPPEHTKFRGMVAAWFTPEKAEQMRPSIQAKADELAAELLRMNKPVDLAENFSMPLAFKVIYEMLGIPFSDYKLLSTNVAVRSSGSSTARDAAAAAQDLANYMERLVAAKEKEPKQDIISDLIQNQLKPGHCSREQLVATAFLLLVAGNATVASMINLGVLTLLQHPDQLAALKKDPGLMHGASEEILRFHTASAYALRRVAKQDVPMAGGQVVIKKDEGIIALNQSANRDETVFPDPDRFDIRRASNPHVAFGSGTHVCIAEWLARVELECALTALFIHKIPGLKLAVPFDQIQYTDPSRDVGVKSLPVTW